MACPRSRAVAPQVPSRGGRVPDSRRTLLRVWGVGRAGRGRHLADAQRPGRRVAGPGRGRLAQAGSPPARGAAPPREPRRWAGPGGGISGSRAAALPGSLARRQARPRHRPAKSALAERLRPGGSAELGDAGRGAGPRGRSRGRGSHLARQKVSQELAESGPDHERVSYPGRPEPPPGHDLATGEDLALQVLHG